MSNVTQEHTVEIELMYNPNFIICFSSWEPNFDLKMLGVEDETGRCHYGLPTITWFEAEPDRAYFVLNNYILFYCNKKDQDLLDPWTVADAVDTMACLNNTPGERTTKEEFYPFLISRKVRQNVRRGG